MWLATECGNPARIRSSAHASTLRPSPPSRCPIAAQVVPVQLLCDRLYALGPQAGVRLRAVPLLGPGGA